eukprot:s2_g11.t1
MEPPTLPEDKLLDKGLKKSVVAQASITRLQRAMEHALQSAGSLDEWWAEVERLESVAEDTERRSAKEQERRQNELWRPPPSADPLSDSHCLAEALEQRWTVAQTEEEQQSARKALLCRLADAPLLTEELICTLLDLTKRCSQPRPLAHVLLDGGQHVLRRRGKDVQDQPMTRAAQEAWEELQRLAGDPVEERCCPKIVAKACKMLSLEPSLAQGRAGVVQEVMGHFRAFGYPANAKPSTHREATLTGALQLCGLRLERLGQRRALRQIAEEWNSEVDADADLLEDVCCITQGCHKSCPSRCCVARCGCECCCRCMCSLELNDEEVRPLIVWLAVNGELAPARAAARGEVCGAARAKALEAELQGQMEEHGVVLGRRQRRKLTGAAAPSPSLRRGAAAAEGSKVLPELILPGDVEIIWVDKDLATATEDLFRRAGDEGGIVALDAEWKPFRTGEPPTPLELVQLAVPSACFLLDIPRLRQDEEVALRTLLARLCKDALLLGFGLPQDAAKVAAEGLGRMEAARCLDLQEDVKRPSGGSGLAEILRTSLHRSLPKEEQCSDWSLRPLTEKQRRYAALDAWALLQLLAVDFGSAPGSGTVLAAQDLAVCLKDVVAPARPLLLPLGPEHVDLAFEKLSLPIQEATPATADAVQCKTLGLVGVASEEVAQVNAQQRCAVVVLRFEHQLCMANASEALGMSRLRLAKRRELPLLFGYEAGGMGPVGLREPSLPIIVDASLHNGKALLVGGGRAGRDLVLPQVFKAERVVDSESYNLYFLGFWASGSLAVTRARNAEFEGLVTNLLIQLGRLYPNTT